MNDSIISPSEKQLNFDLKTLLDEHLKSWDLVVFQIHNQFAVCEVRSSLHVMEISKHDDILSAYKAALEAIPDILFSSLTEDNGGDL